MAELTDAQYQRLLQVRDALRMFTAWSKDQAAAAGLTPAQHQLLLAIRGHAGDELATIGDVAAHLGLRHHSTVELVQRAEEAGLVSRRGDRYDGRVVRLQLTAKGRRVLAQLSAAHLDELRRLTPILAHFSDARTGG